jgi:YVTN family beta-propeller protein
MQRKRTEAIPALIGSLALAAVLAAHPVFAAGVQMGLVAKITLPGKPGHGDWVTYDPGTDKVYVALHESGVAVIDAASNSVAATVDPIKGPNGIAYDARYVYAAAGDSNELVVVSKQDWQIVARVKTKGKTPDGVWFDAAHGRVLVACDDSNWIEIYNGGAYPRLVRTDYLLPFQAKSGPDVGVIVPQKGRLYMPDDNYVEALDLSTGEIGGRWVDTHLPVTKTGATKNMAYDSRTNRLWVGTTAKRVLVLNADTLRTIRSIPAHGGIDEVALDPGLRLLYAFESSARGFDIFSLDGMRAAGFVSTGVGNTHTGAVNPKTHRVYAYEGDANILAVYAPRETMAK